MGQGLKPILRIQKSPPSGGVSQGIELFVADELAAHAPNINYLGHKNIQHTVRYTDMAPDRFKGLLEELTMGNPG